METTRQNKIARLIQKELSDIFELCKRGNSWCINFSPQTALL